ncbi:MAG TPA: RNA-binding domain-containing protein, partial [Candidatus Binatus sp.]|nr:RNA-binding domain-containing protein [Candidatus Binatus sp.]
MSQIFNVKTKGPIMSRPSEPKISRVTLSAIIHATENPDKIISAIRRLDGHVILSNLERRTARGHYGNPIQVVRVQIRAQRDAETFFTDLWRKLSSVDKSRLLERLG